ncbi:hypothetical protein KJ644_01455 [Candidatus Dependentiae bacterium]|nr:hypothetical protein [Candidatus Dependentiae bacterium]MBU4387118.1 hypothetical protein [Candidatus Dependentiae bacterium]MCG2756083.1 hypothetical protein [Candidatus Dependentiae bacterium]
MRKKILLLLIFISGNLFSKDYSDKNYLTTRPILSNLAMQYTTWNTNLYRKPDAFYNGSIQIVPFYQESNNKTDIGNYFGFDWTASRGIENIISVAPADSTKVFASRKIIHSQDGSKNTLAASYYMDPKQTAYGARFDYHQDLDKILDGLYFRVSTPIVEVKNHVDISIIGNETTSQLNDIAKDYSFLDYLSGNIENVVSANNLQEQLKYAKLDSNPHSSSGFADIDIRLGWKYLYKRKVRSSLNVSLLVPTGKTPNGEWLFEPVHGNAHHWGIGAGLDVNLVLWRHDNNYIEFAVVGDYKYLFQGIEKRTVGIFDPNPNLASKTIIKGGQYVLAGQNGQNGVFPLANVLTQDIRVTPGSQFDGIANLTFNFLNWIFDIGYNLYLTENENVSLKNYWENDKYAMAGVSYITTNNFDTIYNVNNAHASVYDTTGLVSETSNVAIQSDYLNLSSVATPSLTSHKIYAALGYQWNKCKYPAMLGIGASYEFASNNSELEGYAVWAKAGLSW